MSDKNKQIDTKLYNFALVVSAVYVFVLVILANRQFLCNDVTVSICPPSPFNIIHLLMHSALFGYLLTRLKSLPLVYRWKWYLLCTTAFGFLALVFLQRTTEPRISVVLLVSCLSFVCFCVFVQEKRNDWRETKYFRYACSVLVLLGLAMILKANF